MKYDLLENKNRQQRGIRNIYPHKLLAISLPLNSLSYSTKYYLPEKKKLFPWNKLSVSGGPKHGGPRDVQGEKLYIFCMRKYNGKEED